MSYRLVTTLNGGTLSGSGRAGTGPLPAGGDRAALSDHRRSISPLRPILAVLVLVGTIGAAVVARARSVAPATPPSVTRLAPLSLSQLPPGAAGPISTALGRDESAYRISGLVAEDPAEGLSARFGLEGAVVQVGSTRLVVGLRAYGRSSSLRSFPPRAPSTSGRVVTYTYRSISESFTNGPLGLEQSFVVRQRPTGTGALTLSVELPRAAHVENGTILLTGGLEYAGIVATDAAGRALPAWMQLRDGRAQLTVDDRGATYPVRIDPFVQQALLRSGGGASGDDFGYSVAVAGRTIVVGAPRHATHGILDAGAVYVFEEGKAGWTSAAQTAELTATDLARGDELGYSVAISGNTIVAGAPSPVNGGDHATCPDPALDTGAAYVFEMPASGWVTTDKPNAELRPTISYCADVTFGDSVGISGTTVVVGASHIGATNSSPEGAAFVYEMAPGGWASTSAQSAVLTASDEGNDAGFGYAVAIWGGTIVVGAPTQFDKGGYTAPGRAYVFAKPSGGWKTTSQTAELSATDIGASDDLGYSVAVDGNTVVVGAPFHSLAKAATFQEGAAYVYVRPLAGWHAKMTQTSELNPDDTAGVGGDYLGMSVAISGGVVLAGTGDDAGEAHSGASYLFVEPAHGWPAKMAQTLELTATPAEHGSYYGNTVAVSGSTAVVGADEADPLGPGKPPTSGLVYVY